MLKNVTAASPEQLRNLPTPARPKVDADDIVVPDGYDVTPILVGLTFPTSLAFAEDGTLFVCEAGSGWPLFPFVGARILAIEPSGAVREVVTEAEARLWGIDYRDGEIYAGFDGGATNKIVKYDVETGERTVLVDGIPGGGFHSVNGPAFGPDGYLYFNQGSVSLNGINGPEGFLLGAYNKYPDVHEIPGQDITLTGNDLSSSDPSDPLPTRTVSGAFKPFGTPAREGDEISGETLCTTGVFRTNPDGSGVELLAWGVRNGFGMAFDDQGDLFLSNFCMEDMGIRPVGNDPGQVLRVENAAEPHGSVQTPDWYGFPDYSADGLPVSDETHVPERGPRPEQLIRDQPELADHTVFLNEPHTGVGRMDFSHANGFGHRGDLFMCQFGSFFPINTPDPGDEPQGFDVVRIDTDDGTAERFMHNKQPGAATMQDGGGLERPIDCAFSPDGESLYVLDFGCVNIERSHLTSYGQTGVLWRVTPEGKEVEPT